MYLLPTKFGPLNAKIDALMVALVLFTIVFLWFKRLLPRINQVLAERADRTEGALERAEAIRAEAAAEHAGAQALLAEARRDAARVTQAAREEGAALIAAAREDGLREREALLADGQALIDAERAAAEAELRLTVPELAAELASRIIGEPVRAAAPTNP
ncbi:F0F1 ATP synthase subunit B family protein [Streptomyces sp. NPDC001940]|uniref:F0F1 ATP synthase subunit B family protein n=1 Tax=Streptomyces sp. NPDC056242 TaxID=3345760 RepID=UPI0035E160A6